MNVRSSLLFSSALFCLGLAQDSSAQSLTFEECSSEAGLLSAHDWGTNGLPYTELFGGDDIQLLMTSGGAAGDFDNDGWQDLILLAGHGGRDRLFMNRGDGGFDLHTHWADKVVGDVGPPPAHTSGGVAVGDFDNDGWQDMFISSMGPALSHEMGVHRLYRNQGDGTFLDVAKSAGVTASSPFLPDGMGATFGDYDLDGDLDLFVCGWRVRPIFGLGNRLYRNDGNGTFTDVTVSAGVIGTRFAGFQPSFVDMNGDRYPELVVSADYSTSRYFINNKNGTFTEFTKPSGTGLDRSGMGSTIADFDGDGLLDWYVSCIYNPPEGYDGNKMYLNMGNHQYTEVASLWGVVDGYWGWGVNGSDFDHNGRMDILETNGFWFPQFQQDPNCLWLQLPGNTYIEAAATTEANQVSQGRGLVVFDYDRDGDQDFVTCNNSDSAQLFRNDLAGSACWLNVQLDTSSNSQLAPNGVGTRVIACFEEREWVRWIGSNMTYLSQCELSAHFGLAGISQLDRLEVHWANGQVTTLNNVPTNQYLTVTAP